MRAGRDEDCKCVWGAGGEGDARWPEGGITIIPPMKVCDIFGGDDGCLQTREKWHHDE